MDKTEVGKSHAVPLSPKKKKKDIENSPVKKLKSPSKRGDSRKYTLDQMASRKGSMSVDIADLDLDKSSHAEANGEPGENRHVGAALMQENQGNAAADGDMDVDKPEPERNVRRSSSLLGFVGRTNKTKHEQVDSEKKGQQRVLTRATSMLGFKGRANKPNQEPNKNWPSDANQKSIESAEAAKKKLNDRRPTLLRASSFFGFGSAR